MFTFAIQQQNSAQKYGLFFAIQWHSLFCKSLIHHSKIAEISHIWERKINLTLVVAVVADPSGRAV
jgi:hypothetical protein